jgi:peptidyl-prolyl cis-trans isomerase A (cyclophilin A)
MLNRSWILLVTKRWLIVPIAGYCLLALGCSPGKSPEESKAPAAQAPARPAEIYKARLNTSKGPIVIEVHRAWAPQGADRFFELAHTGFFDDSRFFRVMKHFVAQFGLSKDPKVSQLWSQMKILDDPQKEKNTRGTVTFAKSGPNTRTTQVFINLADNRSLDGSGFAPFGKVSEGMENVDKLYWQYGDAPPVGSGPEQNLIMDMGNEYLQRRFPSLDFINTITLE